MDGIRPPWKYEDPLCAQIGPDLYFLEEVDGRQQAPYNEYNMAKELCLQCRHLAECRDWGMTNEYHGLWGGLSAAERRRLRRDNRRLSA